QDARRVGVDRPGVTPPTLETERLLLRPFRPDDAADVQQLASAREIAAMTLMIPQPYPEGAAEAWIAEQAASVGRPDAVGVATVVRNEELLAGAGGLRLERAHDRAELGYWIGVPYWGRGYATEAAAAVLGHAFATLGVHRVHARHFTRNPASGRVLEK